MNSTSSSSFTSSPSTEKSQKEKIVETEVMIVPQVKLEDIKDDIKEQVHGKNDFVSTNNIDQGNVNQELQKAEEEQRQANIVYSDQVSEKIEHPVVPIVIPLPENPIGPS